jgi:hypothetical protein
MLHGEGDATLVNEVSTRILLIQQVGQLMAPFDARVARSMTSKGARLGQCWLAGLQAETPDAATSRIRKRTFLCRDPIALPRDVEFQ